MKFKSILFILLTAGLIFLFNTSWQIGGTRIPPLGKFLDPFHGFWQNIETKEFKSQPELLLSGLSQEVTVVYDSLLIPHIFAANDKDLYLAQGYVTAIHRLWQMEFQTHAAAGRISEILGPGPDNRILDYDRSQRRLGLTYGAQQAVEAMTGNPVAQETVEHYTRGINQYIASLRYKDLPFEYKLLDYSPEPWTPLKTALLLMSMAQTLNIGDKDIEMTNALTLFGKEMVDLLYPDREPLTDPVVDNPNEWKFKAIELDSVPMALPEALITVQKLPGPDPTTGSNNWAVAGSKTATGSPILCGDPHLNLSLPSIWFAVQLTTPEVNTMGVSLPGAPGVIIGFNDSIAWSMTNAQRDVVDWFEITFQDKKRNKYKLDNEWVDARKVVEEFKVRGKPVFYDTVIYTHVGPIPYDETYRADNNLKNYAFRWISHDKSEELMALYKLNRAKNHNDYKEALDHYGAPGQNFVFASVSGDIAMRVQGKYPVRRKEEGKFVLDGSQSSTTWQAFIPNEQNVMYKNPERGFVSSANQYPVDATYPYYITATSYEAYRNRRINQVLRESVSITPTDMMKLQGDNYNLKAAESLPYFLAQLDSGSAWSENESAAIAILKGWNYYNDEKSEGASYYEAWWDALMPLAWDELRKEGTDLSYPTTYNTIKLLQEKPDLLWWDIQETPEKENASALLAAAFRKGVKNLESWKEKNKRSSAPWAYFKDSYVGHLLRLEPLSIPVKHGGNHDIVNAHSRTHGPSWRMVVSLEPAGVKAWAVYPGGQSGNPGSYYYSNLLDTWTADAHFRLLFLHKPEDANQKYLFTTTLNPHSK
jgi:penicillin G amidase